MKRLQGSTETHIGKTTISVPFFLVSVSGFKLVVKGVLKIFMENESMWNKLKLSTHKECSREIIKLTEKCDKI